MTTTPKHHRRGTTRTALLGLTLCLTATACSPYGEATRWEENEFVDPLPAIDWPLGAPDMTDEWVAALYTSVSLLAAAHNAHDYSAPVLKEHVGAEALHGEVMAARDWVENGESSPDDVPTYLYDPGPDPLKILDVEAHEYSATIVACRRGWSTSGRDDPPTIEEIQDSKAGSLVEYTLARSSAESINLTRIRVPSYDTCDLTGVRPGFFDPAPPYDETFRAKDFLGTDGVPIPNSQGIMPDCTLLDRNTHEPRTDENGTPIKVC